MKIVKNLLTAAILASAIATTTYAGDVGFPPTAPPPPPETCAECDASTHAPAPGDESDAYLFALALLLALSLLPKP
jgi:hypothetical protein